MPFSGKFYRREFFDIESVNSRNDAELSTTFEKITNSSKFLKSLQTIDTNGLRHFLEQQSIDLCSLFIESDHPCVVTDLGGKTAEVTDTIKNEKHVDPFSKPTKFIELEELKKYNTSLIVDITGIFKTITKYQGLTENLLDYIFNSIAKEIPSYLTTDNEMVKVNSNYKWSSMKCDSGDIDQSVFVCFHDIMMEHYFFHLVTSLDFKAKSDIIVFFSDSFTDQIEPQITKIADCKLERLLIPLDAILKHIDELQRIGELTMTANESDDDYLTRCQKLVENYSVNSKDLAIVPSNMVEEVKKYVLDFRLHVLADLEKNRKERAKRDQNNAKKINQSTANDTISNDTDANLLDSSKNLSDIEYETLLQKKEKAFNDKAYYTRLNIYKRKEEHRLKAIKNFLAYNKHESYVRNVLPQNRQKFLSNFVNNIVNANNKIDKNFNYYIKHANYSKFRAKVKESEELADIQDEKEESAKNEIS